MLQNFISKLKKNFYLFLFFIVLFSIFNSCNTKDEKFIDEGTIEYTASVLDESNPMANMAPSKMKITFKNNRSCVQMSAGMGLFSASFISDPHTKTLTQLVKLLNKKYSLVEDEKQITKENSEYDFVVTPSKETKMISDYKCMKATVHDNKGTMEDFVIYYTKDLGIETPNFSNPFFKVDGVLMEYQLKKFGMEMKFVANKISKESIDESVFQIPADYKKISQQEMDDLFLSLQ